MAKFSARNNELLRNAKTETNAKIYSVLVDLVNDEREDLASKVLEVDTLLEYTSTCIRQRDIREAKEVLSNVKTRIDNLRKEDVDVECLDYLYEGIAKKAGIKDK